MWKLLFLLTSNMPLASEAWIISLLLLLFFIIFEIFFLNRILWKKAREWTRFSGKQQKSRNDFASGSSSREKTYLQKKKKKNQAINSVKKKPQHTFADICLYLVRFIELVFIFLLLSFAAALLEISIFNFFLLNKMPQKPMNNKVSSLNLIEFQFDVKYLRVFCRCIKRQNMQHSFGGFN